MFMAKMLTAEVPRTEKKNLQNRGMICKMNQFSGSGTRVVAELEAPQESPKRLGAVLCFPSFRAFEKMSLES